MPRRFQNLRNDHLLSDSTRRDRRLARNTFRWHANAVGVDKACAMFARAVASDVVAGRTPDRVNTIGYAVLLRYYQVYGDTTVRSLPPQSTTF